MLPQKPPARDILAIYDRQVDTVYRVCYAFMKNKAEAEDMTQETFLRLMTCDQVFENRRHEKAWLIVTASNLCKDSLKKWWRKNENIDDMKGLKGAASLRKVCCELTRLEDLDRLIEAVFDCQRRAADPDDLRELPFP